MVYLPTFKVTFIYIYIPYMDGMGILLKAVFWLWKQTHALGQWNTTRKSARQTKQPRCSHDGNCSRCSKHSKKQSSSKCWVVATQTFLEFSPPIPGDSWSNLTWPRIFQLGWFNHHQSNVFEKSSGYPGIQFCRCFFVLHPPKFN